MNSIEEMAKVEFREGVSAGAAARQVICLLGIAGTAPTLKRMLEELPSQANRRGFDRSCILREFEEAEPEAANDARRKSFARINSRAASEPMPLTLELADGTRCEITHMFDVDGEDTDDPTMAHSVVAGLPDGRWIAQEVDPEMWVPAKPN